MLYNPCPCDDDTFFSGSLILVLTDNATAAAIINPTVLKLPRKEFYGDLLGTNGQRTQIQ